MCQSIPCHKIGDLRGLDIASCYILLLQIGKWLLANDIRASFHFIKSNKLFIGGLVSDLALGTICVMCLAIIRPMVMDVENVVLLLGFFFFFFVGMIILFTERTKLPNLVNICEWERRSWKQCVFGVGFQSVQVRSPPFALTCTPTQSIQSCWCWYDDGPIISSIMDSIWCCELDNFSFIWKPPIICEMPNWQILTFKL